jgi:hypothetical protein
MHRGGGGYVFMVLRHLLTAQAGSRRVKVYMYVYESTQAPSKGEKA